MNASFRQFAAGLKVRAESRGGDAAS